MRHGRPLAAVGAEHIKRRLSVYSVEKLMVSRVLDHRVNGFRLDFTERHWPELGSGLVWLTF